MAVLIGRNMTYIEFFDKTAVENISTCLLHTPERVIYIGNNGKLMNRHIGNYQKIFSARGLDIQFLYKTAPRNNLDEAVALLSEIVETYEDCVFDLSGGEEILNVALGVVYERYPEKNIQIHKFNIRNNAICDCDKDGAMVYHRIPTLSVDENVQAYGGKVLYGTVEEENTYRWVLDEGFLGDIERMWSICSGSVRAWNVQMSMFEAVEKVGRHQDDGLTTVASRSAVEHYLAQQRNTYKKVKGIVNALLKNGLLTRFSDGDEENIIVSYKDPQVRRCLIKAGQVLEMKLFTTIKAFRDKNGEPVYHDAVNGAVIDWDGEFHDEETEGIYDTENEVDILLMHHIVPVFISCKNGRVTADELYKLSVVAERFGGMYAKKVLVTTSLNPDSDATKYFRQRALDMDIRLIEGVQHCTQRGLEKKLKNLWSN